MNMSIIYLSLAYVGAQTYMMNADMQYKNRTERTLVAAQILFHDQNGYNSGIGGY